MVRSAEAALEDEQHCVASGGATSSTTQHEATPVLRLFCLVRKARGFRERVISSYGTCSRRMVQGIAAHHDKVVGGFGGREGGVHEGLLLGDVGGVGLHRDRHTDDPRL